MGHTWKKNGFWKHQAQKNAKQTLQSFDLGLCAPSSSRKPLEDQITQGNCWMGWRSGSILEKQGTSTASPKLHLQLFRLTSLVVSGSIRPVLTVVIAHWFGMHRCPSCYSFRRKKLF